MNFDNIYIILDHPAECRNIGAVCRAMANCDITNLRIIGKKDDYDTEKIHILAIHAAYIYDNAIFFENIADATKDCSIAVGTTRRRGKYRKGKLYLPEEFAKIADRISGKTEDAKKTQANSSNTNGSRVAIVFGNERTGLTDEQLKQCTQGVTIPSSDNFGSLNLSHAVQIICYQLFRQKNDYFTGYTPISLERLNKTVNVITENMQKIGFFKIAGKEDMQIFWKDILSRASLSEGEAKYVEKIFSKTAGLLSKQFISQEQK